MKNKICTLLAIVFSHLSFGQQLTLTPVTTAIPSAVDITHAGDARLFIVDQAGKIRLIDTAGVLLASPFLDISDRVLSGGERGLLGLAFDPGFKLNGFFYVNYTRKPDGATLVSRFHLTGDPSHCDSTTEQVLINIYQPFANHNGGGIHFGPDGFLYIGMGDGGSGGDPGHRAQHLDSLLGKMLRIDVSDTTVPYRIPAGNPYVGKPGRDEIWASGLRNPWRWSFDRLNGELWIADVGQGAYEEINYVPGDKGGINYGWRCYEALSPYNSSNCPGDSVLTFPEYYYGRVGGNCSVTGGYRYRGAKYASLWGKYFFADYCVGKLRYLTQVTADSFSHTLTNAGSGNVVAFGEDVYGELYVAYQGSGIYRISDTSCMPTAYISSEDSITVCEDSLVLGTPAAPDLTYQWMRNGQVITGASSSSYTVKTNGNYSVRVSTGTCTNLSDSVFVFFPSASFSFPSDTLCASSAVITLTGQPAGGVFSGPGITGNRFDPSAAGPGTHKIAYIYTDPSSCVVSATDSVSVFSPAATFTLPDTICSTAGPVMLTGNPTDGIFSGTGVTGTRFYPSAAGAGKHTITYTYTDPASCVATAYDSIAVVVCTGIKKYIDTPDFSIYPNPAHEMFAVSLSNKPTDPIKIAITDLQGRTVLEKTEQADEQRITVSTAGIEAGIYFVTVSDGGYSTIRKICINNNR